MSNSIDLPENCNVNDDGSVTVTLNHPLPNLSQITMRRVKVRDTLAASKMKGGDAEKEIFLLSSLSMITPAEIEELDMSDYTVLQDVYRIFLSLPKPL